MFYFFYFLILLINLQLYLIILIFYYFFMEDKDKIIILFHPLNTLYSYNFSYVERSFHIKEYNILANELNKKNEEEKYEFVKSKLNLLPYIEKEVLEKYKEENLISTFTYYAENEKEKEIIKEEHNLLKLDKYYKEKFILKHELEKIKDKNIIFISEEVEDFKNLKYHSNICKIPNWMIYKEETNYLEYQKKTIPLLSDELLYDLIIECFRQSTNLILYIYNNISSETSVNKLVKKYFKNSINVLYILDTDKKEKLYRKREFAQSNELVKFHPFLNKNFPTDYDLSNYPKINVILQRCPYFYLPRKEYYLENIQQIFDFNKQIVQLHPISVVDILFDRYQVYKFLYALVEIAKKKIEKINMKVLIPYSIKYSIDKNISSKKNLNNFKMLLNEQGNRLQYPIMIKPISCKIHVLKLIINEEGLNNLFNEENLYKDFFEKNENFIIQEVISHGGSMIKNYSINEESYSFIRPSLPDLKQDVLKVDELKNGSMDILNENIYKSVYKDFNTENLKKEEEDNNIILKNTFDKVNKFSLLFVKESKITFFGLDFLYNRENDIFYLLEVNYFPSYRELGKDLPQKFAEHIVKYYNYYK